MSLHNPGLLGFFLLVYIGMYSVTCRKLIAGLIFSLINRFVKDLEVITIVSSESLSMSSLSFRKYSTIYFNLEIKSDEEVFKNLNGYVLHA